MTIEEDFEQVRECLIGIYGKDPHVALDRIEHLVMMHMPVLEKERDALKAEREASRGMWGNMALGDAADKLYRAEAERDVLKADLDLSRQSLADTGKAYEEVMDEVERLRVIIDVADKNRREIGTRCRIAEQEETRLTAERDALKADLDKANEAVEDIYKAFSRMVRERDALRGKLTEHGYAFEVEAIAREVHAKLEEK